MARTGLTVLPSSPWPIFVSMGVLGVVSSFICAVHGGMTFMSLLMAEASWVFLLGSVFGWWKDMLYEGNLKGFYTSRMKQNLWWGFIMFVTSEVFFFFSFFVSWFYLGVGEKSQILLGSWPPEGISPIDPWGIPLVNTILLVSSGFCAGWCKKCVVAMSKFGPIGYNSGHANRVFALSVSGGKKDELKMAFPYCYWGVDNKSKKLMSKSYLRSLRKNALVSMALSVGLGAIFLYLQSLEYSWSSLTFADSTYGGCFFLLTGFHGMHVIVGVCFLSVCWVRIYYNHFTFRRSYVGLECAILYWHFVDAVWIGLFICVYLWPHFT
uniref:Cytochrome c oxidase subunit 3 n=1 Tax=Paratapes textilis TaxID=990946 RepID=H6BHU5_9BIVA|nr:cytochrome c oxidase subunit III [Paratapes textilis]AEH99635.1 cytochrome c oxidase subunit III [Paratapes textilis]